MNNANQRTKMQRGLSHIDVKKIITSTYRDVEARLWLELAMMQRHDIISFLSDIERGIEPAADSFEATPNKCINATIIKFAMLRGFGLAIR